MRINFAAPVSNWYLNFNINNGDFVFGGKNTSFECSRNTLTMKWQCKSVRPVKIVYQPQGFIREEQRWNAEISGMEQPLEQSSIVFPVITWKRSKGTMCIKNK